MAKPKELKRLCIANSEGELERYRWIDSGWQRKTVTRWVAVEKEINKLLLKGNWRELSKLGFTLV